MRVGRPDGGGHYDTNFAVQSMHRLVITYEQSGGGGARARNTDYSAGLIEILRRLGGVGAVLCDVTVASARVADLPLDKRRVHLRNHTLPLRLDSLNSPGFDKLKSDISVGARHPGRDPGSSLGGTSRTLQLDVDAMTMTPEEMTALLSGPGTQ